MEPFKNVYNKKSISDLAKRISTVESTFKTNQFIADCTKSLKSLEMKQRVDQITDALNTHLQGNYRKKVSTLEKLIKTEKKPEGLSGFILWPFSNFIEKFGIDYFEDSTRALKKITVAFTAEFGIRQFLIVHPERTYKLLNEWVKHPNEHVRRLVSEGTRPNLPWGKKIPDIERHLSKNIKLLNYLKNDESEYVRKSVANHMNDIGWINSSLAISTLKAWKNKSSAETQWVIKHALRNLLKQGNKDALKLMGFNPNIKIKIPKVVISPKRIREGERLNLEFKVTSLEKRNQSLMIDYVIHYPKANGTLSPKVFKLKTIELSPKDSVNLEKSIHFKKVTTRRHYPGEHILEIQVNGKVLNRSKFTLY